MIYRIKVLNCLGRLSGLRLQPAMNSEHVKHFKSFENMPKARCDCKHISRSLLLGFPRMVLMGLLLTSSNQNVPVPKSSSESRFRKLASSGQMVWQIEASIGTFDISPERPMEFPENVPDKSGIGAQGG